MLATLIAGYPGHRAGETSSFRGKLWHIDNDLQCSTSDNLSQIQPQPTTMSAQRIEEVARFVTVIRDFRELVDIRLNDLDKALDSVCSHIYLTSGGKTMICDLLRDDWKLVRSYNGYADRNMREETFCLVGMELKKAFGDGLVEQELMAAGEWVDKKGSNINLYRKALLRRG